MALCGRLPPERVFRPRRKNKPATTPATTTSRIATAKKTSLTGFERTRVGDAAEEICAGRAAAAEEEPPTLGEDGVCADTCCAEGAPCGAAGIRANAIFTK